jgi:hypothetical protein
MGVPAIHPLNLEDLRSCRCHVSSKRPKPGLHQIGKCVDADQDHQCDRRDQKPVLDYVLAGVKLDEKSTMQRSVQYRASTPVIPPHHGEVSQPHQLSACLAPKVRTRVPL